VCYHDGEWIWGGRDGANAISDAEQLLCLLYPATEIDEFALDRPDDMQDDISSALAPMGEGAAIGRVVVGLIEAYLQNYTDADGEPVFAAGSYLRAPNGEKPSEAQLGLDVVDSYSMSVTLCIAALGFLKVFQRFVQVQTRREAKELSARIDRVKQQVSKRLTSAMVGLLRSFVVNTVEPKSPSGQNMLTMLNQSNLPQATIVDRLTTRLERVRVRLRSDISLGQTPDTDLENPQKLFECGWSWGLAEGAEKVEFVKSKTATQPGYADARPYLYFTVVALDGINDITSQRTRELDLLDDEQRRLADALQVRWDLSQRYWSAVARFGDSRWPLEDIPWRTSDGEESEYFSLAVSAVLIQDLVNRQATDDDLTRAIEVFSELARRGRIVSRAFRGDPAVARLHIPGVRLSLVGSSLDGAGPELGWIVSDYAAVLLKRTLQAARLSGSVLARERLAALAEATMDHINARALRDGPAAGLWDTTAALFGAEAAVDTSRPSWYMTERIIEGMVAADRTYRQPPLRSPATVSRAVELLNEADHLLNQEMLLVSAEDTSQNRVALDRIEQRLARARRLLNERPGTSMSLATQALAALDELAYARLDATRSA
jgi:hypothetical protein